MPSKAKTESDSKQLDAKKAVLDKALEEITKRFGDGSIIRLGEARHLEVAAISTSSRY